jgi:NADP-dependent 3-hydroxy acid dehydrogenase YdfG
MHSLPISKKVILITGASSGLGEAIANHLVNKGHIVYGVSRNIEENDNFKTYKMDVCDERNVQWVIAKIIEEEDRIDIVINSAGNVLLGPVEYASTNSILNCFNTNIIGSINTIKAALPYMRAQKSGLIINISSLAAANGLPYRGYYSASKAAIERLTESLRLELAPLSVQACYIEPGDFYGTNLDNNTVVIDDKNKVYNWQKTREWISQLISQKSEKPV